VPSRSKIREAIVTALYQTDLLKEDDPDGPIRDLCADVVFDVDDRDWLDRTVREVWDNRDPIDRRLNEVMTGWTVDRLGYVERAILRLGVHEIERDPTIPGKVAVDEAVKLAKTFCDPASAKFVNGALDRVLNESDKAP
jgi:N utilization substance protein B